MMRNKLKEQIEENKIKSIIKFEVNVLIHSQLFAKIKFQYHE